MEIYNMYQAILQAVCLFNGVGYLQSNARPFALALGVSLVALVALFVLQGVGLLIMSEKRGLNKKFLCFIPFANFYQVGRLTGACDVFGHKMKRAWLYAMLAQIVGIVLCVMSAISEYHLFVACGDTITIGQDGYVSWASLPPSGVYAYNFYKVSEYLVSIVGLIELVMVFILAMGLFKKYSPRNYMLFSWLTIFIPMLRFILIFVLRNNDPVDFDEYMRKRREAYVRQASAYGGNPYGRSPYGGSPYGGNPYGNPYGAQETERPKPPEEPFAEFSKESKEPFAEFSKENKEPFTEFADGREEAKRQDEPSVRSDETPKDDSTDDSRDDDLFD